jgi:uncharacterized membrane protein
MADVAGWKEAVTRTVEFAGVAVILVGGSLATIRFLTAWFATSLDSSFRAYRRDIGRAILLGLEFLVAADIINTVAIDPSLRSVAVLAGIVLIRTFLSFSLEVEIEGRWPWERGAVRPTAGKQ